MGPKPFISFYVGRRVTELFDSTCLVCSNRVSTSSIEADVIEHERLHLCKPSALSLRFARVPSDQTIDVVSNLASSL
jgi:hypothetical protein